MDQDNRSKTNAQIIDDLAKRKTVTEPDGTVRTHFHLSHLDPEVLNATPEPTQMFVDDFCCGSLISTNVPPAPYKRAVIEDDPFWEDSSR